MKYLKKILPLILFTTAVCFFFAFKGDNHNFEIAKNLDIFNAIVKEVDMFYVDTVKPQELIEGAIDGMLDQLDPYTVYYGEEDKSELKLMTTGKYAGVGAVIRYNKDKGYVVIAEPYEDMPALKAGLRAGDIILQIDGKDMKGKQVDEVSNALRGDVGTTVVVTVERPGSKSHLNLKVERDNIQLPSVPYYGMIKNNTGYVILNQFTENCSKDVRKAIIDLKQQGATSLILDLRGNLGGLEQEAVEVVNLFVGKGVTIVSNRGKTKQATRDYSTSKEPLDTHIPLVVLVNNQTASSSEIVAGALQDLDRAVIIGTRTYGKGLVQIPRDLPYSTNLKITVAKYYIPSGRCIQAINYAERNQDGSVARIPDSLTHVFHTLAGREVRDGGGILPDIVTKATLPNIVSYLVNDDIIFDYATNYRLAHPTIGPASEFRISDADYEQFKEMVKNGKFDYDRISVKAFNTLKEAAKFEGYLDDSKPEFDALEKKLQHNIDHDLNLFSADIKEFINDEIVKRYYYQKGSIANQIQYDTDIAQAISTLGDADAYKALLLPKKQ